MSMGYACMAEVHICFSAADKCIADEISGFQMFYFSYFTLSYKAIAFELFTLSLYKMKSQIEIIKIKANPRVKLVLNYTQAHRSGRTTNNPVVLKFHFFIMPNAQLKTFMTLSYYLNKQKSCNNFL